MIELNDQLRIMEKIKSTNFMVRTGWRTINLTGAETFESPELVLGKTDFKILSSIKKEISAYMCATQPTPPPALYAKWLEILEPIVDNIRPVPFIKCCLGTALYENRQTQNYYNEFCELLNTENSPVLILNEMSLKKKEHLIILAKCPYDVSVLIIFMFIIIILIGQVCL